MGNIWWRQTKGHGAYTRTNEATNKTVENGSHSKRFWMKHMEEERLSWLVSIFLVSWQYQFSSVTQSRPALCHPMDCSKPGFPVLHQLLDFAHTHFHRVSDAIQPPHPLSSPSPLAPNPSQHHSLHPYGLKWCWRSSHNIVVPSSRIEKNTVHMPHHFQDFPERLPITSAYLLTLT